MHNKILLVTAHIFISRHHLDSEQMTPAVHNRALSLCVCNHCLTQMRESRDLIYYDFMNRSTQEELPKFDGNSFRTKPGLEQHSNMDFRFNDLTALKMRLRLTLSYYRCCHWKCGTDKKTITKEAPITVEQIHDTLATDSTAPRLISHKYPDVRWVVFNVGPSCNVTVSCYTHAMVGSLNWGGTSRLVYETGDTHVTPRSGSSII